MEVKRVRAELDALEVRYAKAHKRYTEARHKAASLEHELARTKERLRQLLGEEKG
jgi:phage-related tail protein